jgi:hypothetical protein
MKLTILMYISVNYRLSFFTFILWYARSKNLNSRNLNGDLDAKLASCIPALNEIHAPAVMDG